MRSLTLVLPHFRNKGMLQEQGRIWQSYPADLRACLHVIVVDDCSDYDGTYPRPTWADVVPYADGLGSLSLYRLTKKKRWNWLACRNLGAKLATTDWLLLTDMDHALPVETLRRVVLGPLDPTHAYRFARVNAPHLWPYRLEDCEPYKMHNDTWLMTTTLFFYDDGQRFVMGFDERLSGMYGTSGEFKDRVFACAGATVSLPDPMIRYSREVLWDASTDPSIYTRKGDPQNHDRLQKEKRRRDKIPNWRPLHGLVGSQKLGTTCQEVACVA